MYIIDTGINIEHEEFEGRARWGKTMPANDVDKDGTFSYDHVPRLSPSTFSDSLLTTVCRQRSWYSLRRNHRISSLRCRKEGKPCRRKGSGLKWIWIHV